MRKRSKAIEKFLMRSFLENGLKLTVRRLLGRKPPRPDGYALVERDGRNVVVEIELTEYQVDAENREKGGSPGVALSRVWRKVQESLYKRLVRSPVKVEARVTLKAPYIGVRDVRKIAEELVRQAREHSRGRAKTADVTTFGLGFPTLARYVETLHLQKVTYFGFMWPCANASATHVGLLPDHVADLVEAKVTNDYRWSPLSERWLLVCASAASVFETAGPEPFPVEWEHARLECVSAASPFDRVFFWDRAHNWCRVLK